MDASSAGLNHDGAEGADGRPDATGRAAAPEALWRELQHGLWVGRAGDVHLGVIERGRRYTLTGADDEVRRGFRTLEAAQDAATGSVPVIAAPQASARDGEAARCARPRLAGRLVATVCVAAIVGAFAAGMIAIAVQLLGRSW